MKLILCGAGKRCIELCRSIKGMQHEIVGVVDGDSQKWGMSIEGYVIQSPGEISCAEDMRICITAAKEDIKQEIRNMLQRKYGYDLKKEIEYESLGYILCCESKIIRTETAKNVKGNKKWNILFDCYSTGLGLGGIEAWTKQLCAKLLEDFEDSIYIISKKGNYEIEESLWKYIIYTDYWTKEPYSRLAIEQLVSIIMEKMPCKVITSQPNNLLLAAHLVKNVYPDSIDIISVIHGSEKHIYSAYLRDEMEADIYIGVSRDIREDMIQFGVEANRIYSMSCPFECERKLIRTYTLNREEPIRIGYAGRLEIEQKRMDLLLKVISILRDKNVNFCMEIAGSGSMQEEMEKCIRNMQLSDRVVFRGNIQRSKIPDFWKNCDLCVNIADYEGRSISIIEAMGNGVVPIVTAVSGTREDIENGKNGYLVSIGDYEAMAQRIEYLANNRLFLPQMGCLAHESVYPKSLMEKHISFWKGILFADEVC